MQDSGNHGFLRRPEPRAAGYAARGQAILAGTADADDGFGWLDDLAAVGTAEARSVAQARVLDWIAAHPVPDAGPAWTPEAIGRRLRSWVLHGGMILPGLDRAASTPYFAALHGQLAMLAQADAATLDAAAGRAIAALALRGAEGQVAPALAALARAAPGLAPGAARNPEALLDRTALLAWTAELAADAGTSLPEGVVAALGEALPWLAALAHGDGALVRAHGGGAGAPGRLEAVLRSQGGRVRPAPDGALGFARLGRGASVLIMDAADPPAGPLAHAAALAFEFSHGGRLLVGSMGHLGRPGWAEAGRASAAHSTLTLAGLSAGRLAADGSLAPAPHVTVRADAPGVLSASHDGWRDSHGVDHHRTLRLASDGLTLTGEDWLQPVGTAPTPRGMAVAVHFHLPPGVRPVPEGAGLRLVAPRGESWTLTAEGGALAVEPSARLDAAAGTAEPSRQAVLRAPLDSMTRPLRWRLARV